MRLLFPHDNQAVSSRFGDAAWITDFITPKNPEVSLVYQQWTAGLNTKDRVRKLWEKVAAIPYIPYVQAELRVGGVTRRQNDIWLYPCETLQISPSSNCANKSFLLTSLLRNEFPPGSVYCALGYINLREKGAHAWVELDMGGQWILETTLPELPNHLIPRATASVYEAVMYFDEKRVYSQYPDQEVEAVLSEGFTFRALEYLQNYICERCLGLNRR